MDRHAAHEHQPLSNPTAYHAAMAGAPTVELEDPRLARVTRLRVLTDPHAPCWELSYCHGELKDGTACHVDLPWYTFSKRKGLSREIVAMCQEVGVYAKGIGILDTVSFAKWRDR